MRQALRALLLPVLVFVAFLALGVFSEHLLRQTGLEESTWSKKSFWYVVHIGVWASGAFCVVRVVNLFFWDRLVASSLGHPVPRLLKDFLALFIFTLGLAGIIGVVFEQSVTAILAALSALGVVLGLALRPIILDAFMGKSQGLDVSKILPSKSTSQTARDFMMKARTQAAVKHKEGA